jgi:hypothetical protein
MRNKFHEPVNGLIKRGNVTGMAGALRGTMLTTNPPMRQTHFEKLNTAQSIDKTAHSSVMS